MGNSKAIYNAITNIIAKMEAVGKDKKNTFQNYSYRSWDALVNELKPLLAEFGVIIVPNVLEHNRVERITEKGRDGKDKLAFYSIIKVEYTLYATDGSFIQSVVYGEGMDAWDKAVPKALTSAFKSMLSQVFAVAFENNDSEQHRHEAYTTTPKQKITYLTDEQYDKILEFIDTAEEASVETARRLFKKYTTFPFAMKKEQQDNLTKLLN